MDREGKILSHYDTLMHAIGCEHNRPATLHVVFPTVLIEKDLS